MTMPVTVHRDDPLDEYVQIRRSSAQDADLDFVALGVLADILSRPVDWQVSAERYTKLRHEGAVVITRAFQALTAKGYLHHVLIHTGGRLITQVHTWRLPRLNCETPGCADCEKRDPQVTDPQKPMGHSDQAKRDTGTQVSGGLKPGGQYKGNSYKRTEDQSPTSDQPPATPSPDRTGTTRIPDDFRPGEIAVRQVMRKRPDVNLRVETRRFIAYWAAKPGKGGEKADWQRAWVNWMVRARGSSASAPDLYDPAPPPAANDPTRFEEFWDAYPNRMGRTAAERAWVKALRSTSPQVIITAAGEFAELCERERTERRYIPAPGKWLDDGRWADELDGEDSGGGSYEPAGDVITSNDL